MTAAYRFNPAFEAPQGSPIRELFKYTQQPGMISFAVGYPAPSLFDAAGLARSAATLLDSAAAACLQYGATEGTAVLTQTLKQLTRERIGGAAGHQHLAAIGHDELFVLDQRLHGGRVWRHLQPAAHAGAERDAIARGQHHAAQLGADDALVFHGGGQQGHQAALAAIACTAALAQAPATNTARPPSEVNPAASGGPAAANAQHKADDRAARSTAAPANPAAGDGRGAPVAEINPSASGGKAAAKAEVRVNARLMDANGDGMVSRQEWDAYHVSAWNSLSPTGSGVSTADLDRMNRTPATH